MEETVEQSPVLQKEMAEIFVNGKNAVPVGGVDQFKGHGSSALHGIEVPTGGAETAVAAERDKFQFSAVWAAVHGAAKGGIAAVYHFLHVFNDRGTWMKNVNHFFIMFFKNIL